MPTAQNSHQAVEVTAAQAWFLADHLRAGSYPWKLAITTPYVDPNERDAFNERCTEDLTAQGIIDDQGQVNATLADSIRTVCQARQWFEWLTIIDEDRILRAVLARNTPPDAVVAMRYAQMVTFTPMIVDYSEALVPIITTGLDDQPPARFTEFSLPMCAGAAIDQRVAAGADIVSALTELGIPESDAEVMEIARSGERSYVELTAHEATNGARHQTDVCINVINTGIGRILVSPLHDQPGAGGDSVFAPAEPLAIAMALRDLTARLPLRDWFPDESFSI